MDLDVLAQFAKQKVVLVLFPHDTRMRQTEHVDLVAARFTRRIDRTGIG
ncbi:MAG: hypothetical protein ACPHQP_00015 [Longimicrobiales bacterium]